MSSLHHSPACFPEKIIPVLLGGQVGPRADVDFWRGDGEDNTKAGLKQIGSKGRTGYNRLRIRLNGVSL